MIADRPFSKLALLVLLFLVLLGGILSLLKVNPFPPKSAMGSGVKEGDIATYSPANDLEAIDIHLVQSAHSNIDVAMYAFTDLKIETALINAAGRGVKIRIYSDALQYSDEEARSLRTGLGSATDKLSQVRGIYIKVKGGTESMHLKAFCIDGTTLRTGSANWSVSGETKQDNDLYVIKEPTIVEGFETDFDALWYRANNRVIK
jgi:phosphatidylserine/phosphatidylglycerophosphate/cardiolipin synthase-like enzyme